MAEQQNIVITSTQNTIKVDFGVYAGSGSPSGKIPNKKTYQKWAVEFTETAEDYITAITYMLPQSFPLSVDGLNNTFKVDSINNSTPESLSDLYSKLSALIE